MIGRQSWGDCLHEAAEATARVVQRPQKGSRQNGVVFEEASRRQRKVTDVSRNELAAAAARTVSMSMGIASVEYQIHPRVMMTKTSTDVVVAPR